MHLNEKAKEAAEAILAIFQIPNELPKPLATIFINRKDRVPFRNWSWRNQLLVALHGHTVLLRILGFEHDADLGGCWEYIQHYAAQTGIEVLDACGRVLDRTCEAVALILDEAENACSTCLGGMALATAVAERGGRQNKKASFPRTTVTSL